MLSKVCMVTFSHQTRGGLVCGTQIGPHAWCPKRAKHSWSNALGTWQYGGYCRGESLNRISTSLTGVWCGAWCWTAITHKTSCNINTRKKEDLFLIRIKSGQDTGKQEILILFCKVWRRHMAGQEGKWGLYCHSSLKACPWHLWTPRRWICVGDEWG